jgi:PAS domain S-box-containing protein
MMKKNSKILIVDHDPQASKKLFETLEQGGYCTKIISDGGDLAEATEAAIRENTYNLAFLDAAIAVNNEGYLSFGAKLQKLSPATKIIFMLNTIEQQPAKESTLKAQFRFLLKPVENGRNILHLVRNCLYPQSPRGGLLVAKNFSEYISGSADIKDILQKLVNEVVKKLGYEACAVILRREDDPLRLQIAEARGISLEHQQGFHLKVGEGITGKVIETGKLRLVPNILAEEDYRYPGFAIHENLCSMISLPIHHNRHILGALNVYTGAGYFHVFDRNEITLLSTLANWTAFAIQNVEKYETKEKARRRLIEEIILETPSSDSLEKMAQAVLEKSVALAGGDAGYIAFVDFEIMRFRPVFGYRRPIDSIQNLVIGSADEGITGHVVRHGEAEIIDNVFTDARYRGKRDNAVENTKSKVIVPLKYQGRVIGVLGIESEKSAYFKDEDKRILTVLASQLTLIFQKQRLDQAFKELGYLFRDSHDLNEIYDTVVKCAAEFIGTNAVALWEKGIDNSFVMRACLGLEEFKEKELKIPSNKGIIAQVIAKHDYVLIEDVSKNMDYVYPEMITDAEFKWLLCVPMFFGNEVFGVIDIYSRRPHGFFEQEINYFKALASQAGVAIQNAKLIDQFNRIGQTITSSQEIKEILENIARSAIEVLCAEPVTLFQYDQTRKCLVTPPIYAGRLFEEQDYVEKFEFTGHSFAELIVAKGESIYIEQDIDYHPFTKEAHVNDKMPKKRFNEREKIKSLAAIILRAEDEIVGLMFLNYRTPQRFSAIEKKIMETFAAQAAIAIKNSRLIEKLRNNEAFLKNIIEKTPDPIVVTENQKKENDEPFWKIELANQVAHEIFGYNFSKRELEGKDTRELFGDQLELVIQALREASGEISDFETFFLHKDGHAVPISLSTSILQKDAANRIVKTIGIAKDLTSKKELEKSKITIEKLRITLADVGHEFGSPLHNIITQLGGLKYQLDKNYGENPQVKKTAKIIEEEAFRAARQMKNTLFSTVESLEAMKTNFEKGFIRDTILLCANRFFEKARKRGITIIVFDSVKRLPPVFYDKTQMEQVFTNLLDNAVKYSHFNRDIDIEGRELDGAIEISIIDRGLGIPETQFEHIFKAFSRGEFLDTTRFIPGTGLGLTIAKEIVERHKGKISVHSVPFVKDPVKIKNYEGYETTFSVSLPKNPNEVKNE